MNERRVLFIVEGSRGEPRLLRKMHSTLFGTQVDNIFWHGTVIHDLIARVFIDGILDDDLDIVSVLRESITDVNRRKVLEQEFSDIYLVFDMDPHDPRYDKDLLDKAMRFFSDSTVNGKLYLNYPMLESYRHLRRHDDEDYLERTVTIDEIYRYKTMVELESHPDFKQLNGYTPETFDEIIRMNLRKANSILNGDRSVPDVNEFLSWSGSEILDLQTDSMVRENRIHVLNTSMFYPVEFAPSRFIDGE